MEMRKSLHNETVNICDYLTVTGENAGVSEGIHRYINSNTTAELTALRHATLYIYTLHEHIFL